jgi:signal peptidase II
LTRFQSLGGWFLAIVLPLLVTDQLIKVWIKLSFSVGEQSPLIPGLIELQFIENEGMAFGWALPGMAGKLLLTSFRLVAAVGLGFYFNKLLKERAHRGLLACISLIWAGAIGNIIDSAVYGVLFSRSSWGLVAQFLSEEGGYAPILMGNVVDMFHFTARWPAWWPIDGMRSHEIFPPIWNLADAAISIGVITLLIAQRRFFADASENVVSEPATSSEGAKA